MALGFAFVLTLAVQSAQPRADAVRRPVITHGVASGDVRATTAIVWARANMASRMHVQVAPGTRVPRRARRYLASAVKAADFTAQVKVRRLRPGTAYTYRVWFSRRAGRRVVVSRAAQGSFRTAPAPTVSAPLSFVYGGDLGGQDYCRNVAQGGYGILRHAAGLAPHFFLATGDMVYADEDCPADGPDGPGGRQNVPGRFPSVGESAVDWGRPAQVQEVYWQHWRYNRADPHQRRLLRTTTIWSQWDDHEVINDFGGAWPVYIHHRARTGYPNLVRAGRRALFNYGAIDGNLIYRSFRWGKDAEFFLLDNRSYRSQNDLPDTPGNAKTLLGAAQLRWLKAGLSRSTATWKVVSSTVALSVRSGADDARDGWADGHSTKEPTYTGFERELADLLAFVDGSNLTNVLFISGDVHQARASRYVGDYNADGDQLLFHELSSGPMGAAPRIPSSLDPTFGPVALYAGGGFLNFGYVRLDPGPDGRPQVRADIRGEDGAVLPGSAIALPPQ